MICQHDEDKSECFKLDIIGNLSIWNVRNVSADLQYLHLCTARCSRSLRFSDLTLKPSDSEFSDFKKFSKLAYAKHWATHGGILVITPKLLEGNESWISQLDKEKVNPYKQVYQPPTNKTAGVYLGEDEREGEDGEEKAEVFFWRGGLRLWTKNRRAKRRKGEGETIGQLDFSGSKQFWSAAFRLVEGTVKKKKQRKGKRKQKSPKFPHCHWCGLFAVSQGKPR